MVSPPLAPASRAHAGQESLAQFFAHLLDAGVDVVRDNSVVLVARRNGTVVGHVAGFTAQSSPTRQLVTFGVLRSMYVRSDTRGAGVGRRLTEAFIDWACDQGGVEVHVDSYFENANARRLYERWGFAPRSVAHALRL